MTTPVFKKARLHLARRDAVLKTVIQSVGDCTMPRYEDRFAALAGSIISQQISTKAAASIRAKLTAAMGRGGLTAGNILKADQRLLRDSGLSTAKTLAIRHLAECVANKTVNLKTIDDLTDEEVVQHLIPVRGIGRWTAEMFLMFSLGRLDVLPVADLGFRNAVKLRYELPEPPDRNHLETIGEKWRPYRSIATWYLWQSLIG